MGPVSAGNPEAAGRLRAVRSELLGAVRSEIAEDTPSNARLASRLDSAACTTRVHTAVHLSLDIAAGRANVTSASRATADHVEVAHARKLGARGPVVLGSRIALVLVHVSSLPV